jgi:hypothetical protein
MPQAAMKQAPQPAWMPINRAPLDGLMLLKVKVNGEFTVMVGRYSHIHGGFCSPPILGMNEAQLFPEMWAVIPAFDE